MWALYCTAQLRHPSSTSTLMPILQVWLTLIQLGVSYVNITVALPRGYPRSSPGSPYLKLNLNPWPYSLVPSTPCGSTTSYRSSACPLLHQSISIVTICRWSQTFTMHLITHTWNTSASKVIGSGSSLTMVTLRSPMSNLLTMSPTFSPRPAAGSAQVPFL